MISLGRAIARMALEDAFRAMMTSALREAMLSGNHESFHASVEELIEGHRQGARAIDSDQPG